MFRNRQLVLVSLFLRPRVREDLLPPSELGLKAPLQRPPPRSLELGAKKFHEQRTTGPLLFESAPAPPSAGFNVTFEDLTLDTAAGAPLIFARLTAVTTKLF